MSRLLLLTCAALSGFWLVASCANSQQGSNNGITGGSSGFDAASGGSSGADAGSGGSGGVSLDGSGGATDAPGDAISIDSACVGDAEKAVPIPLDLFVMLDQSGSMLLDAGNQLSRWQT